MHVTRTSYRQGDILIVPCASVPADTTPVPRENGKAILAHGEVTGHHHAIVDERAELVSAEQASELYLLVHGLDPVKLTHQEHGTIEIPPGDYHVLRQREYAPEETRTVAD
jgi:hypothetical protein